MLQVDQSLVRMQQPPLSLPHLHRRAVSPAEQLPLRQDLSRGRGQLAALRKLHQLLPKESKLKEVSFFACFSTKALLPATEAYICNSIPCNTGK